MRKMVLMCSAELHSVPIEVNVVGSNIINRGDRCDSRVLVNWFSENKNRTSDLQCLPVPMVKNSHHGQFRFLQVSTDQSCKISKY